MIERLAGLITKAQSGFFTVHAKGGPVVCRLRGQLQEKRLDTDLAALGDRVTFLLQPDGTGIIETIAERTRVLARRTPSGHSRQAPSYHDRPVEQVIVANPDQAMEFRNGFALKDGQPMVFGRKSIFSTGVMHN